MGIVGSYPSFVGSWKFANGNQVKGQYLLEALPQDEASEVSCV